MFPLLLILGVLFLAFALFSFHHAALRRLGGIAILAATGLAGYFLSGEIWVGAIAATAWFFLPWVELLTRVRKLRLPLDRSIAERTPPSSEKFPELRQLTRDIEELGFEHVDDAGWEWEDTSQFVRHFYNEAERSQASITLHEQGEICFSYTAISSKSASGGTTWMTWNCPFLPTMKLSPDIDLRRAPWAESFAALQGEHQDFITDLGMITDDLSNTDPGTIPALFQEDTRRQVDHNLDQGLITLAGEGTFRYSWRGLFFLWTQTIKEMAHL